MKFSLALFLTGLGMFAQSRQTLAPKVTTDSQTLPSKPPIISAELRAEFWRAQAEAIAANAQASAAKVKLDAAQAKLSAACGEKYQLSGDQQTGEPVCVEKPKPVDVKETKK